jgi:hypothetical protein
VGVAGLTALCNGPNAAAYQPSPEAGNPPTLMATSAQNVRPARWAPSEQTQLSTRTNLLLLVANTVQLAAYITGYWFALIDRYGGEGYIPGTSGLALPIVIVLGMFCSVLCASRDPFLTFALQFINWFVMIPMIAIAYYGAGSMTMLGISIAAFATICGLSRIKITLPPLSLGNERMFGNAMVATAIVVAILTISFGGLRNFNLDFSRVYEYRQSAAEELPPIFEYIRPITVATIIPLGVALALWRRNLAILMVYTAVSLVLFALSAHKSIFFVPFFVLSAFYSMRSNGRRLWVWPAVLSAIALIATVEILLFYRGVVDNDWVTSLFFRRALMTPSMLNYIFYDVFYEYPKYFWADSRITLGMFQSPYTVSAPYLVGLVRFSDVELAANTGWLGSGMAQAGSVGIFVYSIAIGLFVALMRGAAQRAGLSLVAAASVMQLSALTRDADLMTTLLTHGLALFLILILFLPNRTSQSSA